MKNIFATTKQTFAHDDEGVVPDRSKGVLLGFGDNVNSGPVWL